MERMTEKIGVFLACGALTATLLLPGLAFAQSPGTNAKPTPPGTSVPDSKTPTTATQQTSATPLQSAQGPAAPTSQSGVLPTSNTTFTPLTQLPGIEQAASATTFPRFINTLYKICLGAGASLAVIMIMVAGVQYMTSSGSVSGNSKAKERIQNSLLGLLLVLAPTIVFGIINPSILNLDFASQFTGLQGAAPTVPTGSNPNSVDTTSTLNIKVTAGATDPVGLDEIPDSSQRTQASSYMDACHSTGGTPRLSVGSTLVECVNAAAGAAPGCRDAVLRCEGGNNDLSRTLEDTGTVLRKHVTGVKSASDLFVTQCSVISHGTGSTRGCTRQCSPAGTNSCDTDGCSEYTSYCSIPERVVMHRSLDSSVTPHFIPVEADVQKVSTFRTSCSSDHGTFSFRYSGSAVTCSDGNTNARYPDCVNADLICNP